MSENTQKIINIVISILVAIAGWVFVVVVYEPMTNVRYSEVPIHFTGEDTLASRGYGIVDANRDAIKVTLNQRRIDSADISAEDISVIADVSEATEGDNSISLQISGPEGTSIVESEARTVSVDVEKADSKTVDVIVDYKDKETLAVDEEPLTADLSNTRATIVGAGSEIGSVDRVIAYLNLTEVTDIPRNFTRKLVCIDKEGNEIPHMVTYPEEIKFSAISGYLKTVKLLVNVKDTSKDNYQRTYTAPSTITIKGTLSDLENIDSITTAEINIGNIYESTELDLSLALPDDIELANSVRECKISITVTEKPKEKTETTDTTEN